MTEEEEWLTIEEARFQLIRAMLEEFPDLRHKIIDHLRKIYPDELR